MIGRSLGGPGFASKSWGAGGALTLTAGFYLLAAGIVFFPLPETKGADLSTVGAEDDPAHA